MIILGEQQFVCFDSNDKMIDTISRLLVRWMGHEPQTGHNLLSDWYSLNVQKAIDSTIEDKAQTMTLN